MKHQLYSFGFRLKCNLVLVVLLFISITYVSCANLKPLVPLSDEEVEADSVPSLLRKREILHNIFAAADINSTEDDGPTSRIINGDFVQKDTYPWFASMINEEYNVICGGFLIAPGFVATAAHCLDLPEEFSPVRYVAIGVLCYNEDNCGQEIDFFEISDSDKFIFDSFSEFNNDFGLIRLGGNRSAIKPVKIDDGTYSESYESGKANLWSTGLGIDLTENGQLISFPDRLKHVEMQYVTNSQCASDYQIPSLITSSMLCAKGLLGTVYAGTCNGDSGGPLYDSENEVVVGVVSFGKAGCEDPAYPSVFGRVSVAFATFRDIICAEDMNAEICNSSSPSTAPVVGPAICKDSELQFWANWTDRKLDCEWVGKKKSRCNKIWNQSHCPEKCAKCDSLKCKDSKKKFYVYNKDKQKYMKRGCGWIKFKDTEKRCGWDGVKETCRETCGYC